MASLQELHRLIAISYQTVCATIPGSESVSEFTERLVCEVARQMTAELRNTMAQHYPDADPDKSLRKAVAHVLQTIELDRSASA